MRTWADDVEDQRRERDREQRRLIECQHGALFSHCEICKRDARIAELEAALCDVVNSYEDARDRIRSGTADKPSVSGQTFIDRAKRLLSDRHI